MFRRGAARFNLGPAAAMKHNEAHENTAKGLDYLGRRFHFFMNAAEDDLHCNYDLQGYRASETGKLFGGVGKGPAKAPQRFTCPSGIIVRTYDTALIDRAQETYKRDINKGVIFGLSECASSDFVRPMIEMDITEKDVPGGDLSDMALMRVAMFVVSVMASYFTGGESRWVVLMCDPKLKEDGVTRKRGMHIVCNNRVVTVDMLRDMLTAAKEIGLAKNKLDPNMIDMAPVHDDFVTLRMPGACKVVPCHFCKGDTDLRFKCLTCIGFGKMVEKSPYWPRYVIVDGRIEPPKDEDRFAFITPQSKDRILSGDYYRPNGMPMFIKKPRGTGVLNVPVGATDRIPAAMKEGNLRNSPEIVRVLTQLVRGACAQYANVRLDRIYANKARVVSFLCGQGQHYCCTMGSEHGSNRAKVEVHRTRSGCYMVLSCGSDVCAAKRKLDPTLGRFDMVCQTDANVLFSGQSAPPRILQQTSSESSFIDKNKQLAERNKARRKAKRESLSQANPEPEAAQDGDQDEDQ